jgi:hypothetical protein
LEAQKGDDIFLGVKLHFGHYKAAALSEIISRHDVLKATICNKWGFVLDISCMLYREDTRVQFGGETSFDLTDGSRLQC